MKSQHWQSLHIILIAETKDATYFQFSIKETRLKKQKKIYHTMKNKTKKIWKQIENFSWSHETYFHTLSSGFWASANHFHKFSFIFRLLHKRRIQRSSQKHSFADVLQKMCFAKFNRKMPVLESLFSKFAGLRLSTLLKKTSTQVFSCEICQTF